MLQAAALKNLCYNAQMHNSFYASGFLYSLKTHQILLLQAPKKNGINTQWSTISGESEEGEDARSAFQRIVHEHLNLNLEMEHIYPIYDYLKETNGKVNYVFYAEVKNTKFSNLAKEGTLSWITFSETIKLLFTDHIKQDVIVGERVINAKWRLTQEPRI